MVHLLLNFKYTKFIGCLTNGFQGRENEFEHGNTNFIRRFSTSKC
jgi:hypothetical protein